MRLFGRKEKNIEDFKEGNNELRIVSIESRMVGAWFSMAMGLISAVGSFLFYFLFSFFFFTILLFVGYNQIF